MPCRKTAEGVTPSGDRHPGLVRGVPAPLPISHTSCNLRLGRKAAPALALRVNALQLSVKQGCPRLNRKAAPALALRQIWALTRSGPRRNGLTPGRISRKGYRPTAARANRPHWSRAGLDGKAPDLLASLRPVAIGAGRHMLITAHYAGDNLHPVAHALSIAAFRATRPRRAGFR